MAHGSFCWYQLMTPDVEGALSFYPAIFPWTVSDEDMGEMGTYHMLHRPEGAFGGVMSLPEHIGQPPHWITYIAVDDVDDSTQKVSELGGSIALPPATMEGVGRMAVVADPQGAYFILFQPAEGSTPPPPTVFPAPVGAVTWNELTTSDTDASAAFYSSLLGWRRDVQDMGTGPYNVMYAGETPQGGIFLQPPDAPVAWTTYFEVADIDATASKIGELGGTVLKDMTVPTVGRFAIVDDPAGAAFAIMQSEQRA